MRIQLANGCQMGYDDIGHGPPVVLLHAFPLSRAMWEPQRWELQSRFRVITPDQRGFGGREGFTQPPSIDQMADDAAELLDALQINEPVVLGGLSMGGYVALAFARRHSQRLRGLVLADTKADADSAEAKASRNNAIAFMKDHTSADLIEQMMPKMVSPHTLKEQPAVVERIRRIAAAQHAAGIVGALEALRDRPDANPGLVQIAVPTLVLVGEDDAITPPTVAVAMASRIKRATVKSIPRAGHLANLEQPAAFNAAVVEYLRSLG